MSDPKSYGEPVEESASVDDVVGRANEGLADAEAAGRDAVTDTPAAESAAEPESVVESEPADVDAAPEPAAVTEPEPEPEPEPVDQDEAPSAANEWAAEPPSWAAAAEASESADEPEPVVEAEPEASEPAVAAYEAPTTAYPTSVTPSEPAPEQEAVATAAAVGGAAAYGQPIFVQAPEAPRPRGNRAAAGAIGLVAAAAFAVLYLAVWLGVGAITGDVTAATVGTDAVAALGTWALWVPVVVFFLAFWLVGAIINRGRWGVWVHIGLLVGLAAYGGHLLGQLFQAPFWTLTASEGADLVEGQLLAPLAVAAFVIARELTIWFGAWAAARGRRVTELNIEAQREYERTLEAGPQLTRV